MIASYLTDELNFSTTLLLKKITQFNINDFNKQLSHDEWSSGQIAEHILLMDMTVTRVMGGRKGEALRLPDAKLEVIQNTYGDRNLRLQCPPELYPSDALKDPFSMQERIGRQRQLIIQALSSEEPESLCLQREHWLFGPLTMIEWMWVVVYHTERHLKQFCVS